MDTKEKTYDSEEKNNARLSELARLENNPSAATGEADNPNTYSEQGSNSGVPSLRDSEHGTSGVNNKISGKNKSDEGKSKTDSNSGGLYKTGDKPEKPSKIKAAGKAVQGNKKGLILGGGGGGIILTVTVIIATLITHALVTLEKDITKYEGEAVSHYAQKAAQSLFQKLVCTQVVSGCKNNPEASDPDEDEAKPDPDAAAKGEGVQADMDEVNLADPAIDADLAKGGITAETSGGKLTGLSDEGTDVTDDIAGNDSVMDQVETGLPEADVGIVTEQVPLEGIQEGVPFTSPGEEDTTKDFDKALEDEVVNGAPEDAVQADINAEDSQTKPGSNATPAEQAAYNSGEGFTSESGGIGGEVAAGMADGDTSASIISKVQGSFGDVSAGDVVNANQWISLVCSFEKKINEASKDRVPEIVKLLSAHLGVLGSLAGEEQTGHISSKEVSQAMTLFDGDPSIAADLSSSDAKTITSTPNEANLPFSSSAEWGAITGSGEGIPMEDSAKPTTSKDSSLVNAMDKLNNEIPGGNITCDAENNVVGSIATNIGGFGIGLTGIFDMGLSDAAIAASNIAVQLTIRYVFIPKAVAYFAPIGVDGLEDAVQWFNNAGAGTNLAFNNYGRRMGANPVSNTTASQVFSEAAKEDNAQLARQPWTNRVFAFSNPDSIVSRMSTEVPVGTTATVGDISNFLTTAPTTFLHDLASVFAPKTYAAIVQPTPGQSDGITQYDFTDPEINKYDAVDNENYLFQKITAGGNSMTRISMLGDPNTYTDTPAGDPNNNDLMHCYVDSFALIYEDEQAVAGGGTGIGPSHNCDGIGDVDYANDTPPDPNTLNNELNTTIGNIYRQDLCGSPSDSGSSCDQQVDSKIGDEIGHYRQYLLDLSVMNDYVSLTNNK